MESGGSDMNLKNLARKVMGKSRKVMTTLSRLSITIHDFLVSFVYLT